jgi:hypothetical protein
MFGTKLFDDIERALADGASTAQNDEALWLSRSRAEKDILSHRLTENTIPGPNRSLVAE